MTRLAHGWGLATVHSSGQVLDAWFPAPALGEAVDREPPKELVAAAQQDDERDVRTEPVLGVVLNDLPPRSLSDYAGFYRSYSPKRA